MATNRSNTILTTLLAVLLSILGWFGNVTYNKLNAIDGKVEALLIATGIDKTEIQNLKDRLDWDHVPHPKKEVSFHLSEFVLPNPNKSYVKLNL